MHTNGSVAQSVSVILHRTIRRQGSFGEEALEPLGTDEVERHRDSEFSCYLCNQYDLIRVYYRQLFSALQTLWRLFVEIIQRRSVSRVMCLRVVVLHVTLPTRKKLRVPNRVSFSEFLWAVMQRELFEHCTI
jgi:hypothetical protein